MAVPSEKVFRRRVEGSGTSLQKLPLSSKALRRLYHITNKTRYNEQHTHSPAFITPQQ